MREVLVRFIIGIAVLVTGCTVHPRGEQVQRSAAAEAGKAFREPAEQRRVTPLAPNATPDQMVDYALLTNGELERRYWEWKSAIEQIPQDGTQNTNLALFVGASIVNGSTTLSRTTASLGNDPMADIVLPPKLSTAARRALENARAAGLRFQKAKLELRRSVLDAYYDWALATELLRLERQNASLLETTAAITEARVAAGSAGQQDLLKARNELDLSRNESSSMIAQLPALRASLNAILAREPRASLSDPSALPAIHVLRYRDEELLSLAAERNPELAALARETSGQRDSIRLARLQYLPDFSLSGGTDLAGITQTLAGTVTLPLLRYEAIDAAVRQAEARLRAIEAMRRQSSSDLAAQVVLDVATLRDADRQLDFFEQTLLPRATQAVDLARASYEAGRSSLLDLLDTQRSLISLRRLVANLRVTREKRLADLESIVAMRLAEQT